VLPQQRQGDRMRYDIQGKVDLLVKNAHIARKGLGGNWISKRMIALMYSIEGRMIDCSAVRRCFEIMDNGTDKRSQFGGFAYEYIAAMLAMQANPQETFERTLVVYGMMLEKGFIASHYLAAKAYHVASTAKPRDYPAITERMKKFREGLEANDIDWSWTFAVPFALSDNDMRSDTDRIGELYKLLSPKFSWIARRSLLPIAQAMVLCGFSGPPAADRVFALRNTFKKHGVWMDNPILNMLAPLNVTPDEIVSDIRDAKRYLHSQKGVNIFSFPIPERPLLLSVILASSYSKDLKNGLIAAFVPSVLITARSVGLKTGATGSILLG
jgi:hypothetical protein